MMALVWWVGQQEVIAHVSIWNESERILTNRPPCHVLSLDPCDSVERKKKWSKLPLWIWITLILLWSFSLLVIFTLTIIMNYSIPHVRGHPEHRRPLLEGRKVSHSHQGHGHLWCAVDYNCYIIFFLLYIAHALHLYSPNIFMITNTYVGHFNAFCTVI